MRFRYLLYDLRPELFKMEFVQLLREQSPAPGPAEDPVHDPVNHEEDLVFGLHGQQFAADLRVATRRPPTVIR